MVAMGRLSGLNTCCKQNKGFVTNLSENYTEDGPKSFSQTERFDLTGDCQRQRMTSVTALGHFVGLWYKN